MFDVHLCQYLIFSHSTFDVGRSMFEFDVGRSMFDVHLCQYLIFSHSTFDVGRSMFDVHLFLDPEP